jgi:hypothetical protein
MRRSASALHDLASFATPELAKALRDIAADWVLQADLAELDAETRQRVAAYERSRGAL